MLIHQNKSVMESNIKKLIKITSQILGNEKVLTIFELGAQDGNNTEIFHRIYKNSKIYAFECNPTALENCRKKISNLRRAKLIKKAVSDRIRSI
jgi:trans-aconitate methyltransferase